MTVTSRTSGTSRPRGLPEYPLKDMKAMYAAARALATSAGVISTRWRQYLPQVAEYNDLIQRRILESECRVKGTRQYISLGDYLTYHNILVKPSTDEIRASLLQDALTRLNHTSTPANLKMLVTEILKSAPDDMRASLQIAVGGKRHMGGTRAAGTPAGSFTAMIGDVIRGKKGAWRIDDVGQVVPRAG